MAQVKVKLIDPAAFTLVYDHALAEALAARGVTVELVTSHFPFAAMPPDRRYRVDLHFYRQRLGPPGSRRERWGRLAQHGVDMLALARETGPDEILHFQWFALQELDVWVRPRRAPVIFTAHDILPREPRRLQPAAQRRLLSLADAVIVHYKAGRRRLAEMGVPKDKIHVIPIGAYRHQAQLPTRAPLPAELTGVECPVVLFFGLIRHNKGLDVLLHAWRGIERAELWVVGQPRMAISTLREAAPPGVRFLTRWITEAEIPAIFSRADLVVLPYREIDQSGVAFTALAFGRPLLCSDAGGFADLAEHGAAATVPAGDAAALHLALRGLIADQVAREQMAQAARAAAAGPLSWERIAAQTEDVYRLAATSRRTRRYRSAVTPGERSSSSASN